MRPFVSLLAFCTLTLPISARAFAETVPATIFGDHMVLQSGRPLPIWGTDTPGQKVTVSFGDVTVSGVADANGHWNTSLPTEAVNATGRDLTIAGSSTTTLHDVVVGEVWLASGQSNMWYPMPFVLDADKEIAAANHPNLRLFQVQHNAAPGPLELLPAQWTLCTPDTVKEFSAVGYFFGRDLSDSLNEPVGIIHSSWPGSYIESWISGPTLVKDPDYEAMQDRWTRVSADLPGLMAGYQKSESDWQTVATADKAAGTKPPREPVDPLGKGPADMDHAAQVVDHNVDHYSVAHPSGLYNAMIAPLVPFAIRGVIWYQGESNAERPYQYMRLFPEMISDWRANWGEGDFPFLYVQLPFIGNRPSPSDPPRDDWFFAAVREAQRKAQTLNNVAMIVTTDNTVDVDIHPRNKQLFGARLRDAALDLAYGQNVPRQGPEYLAAKVEGSTIRIRFNPHGKLTAKGGEPLQGFSIAGKDHKYVWASAHIEGASVVVSSPDVTAPVAARYAWTSSDAWNLFNDAGLPASPFQTDDYFAPAALHQ